MIKLTYIGKKASATDNLAGTGKTWHGHGDTQEVNERAARILLAHPTQWQLADATDAKVLARDPVTMFMKPDGEKVTVTDTELRKPLERMTVDELRAYALKHYQKEYRPSMSRKAMFDNIEELALGMDPIER